MNRPERIFYGCVIVGMCLWTAMLRSTIAWESERAVVRDAMIISNIERRNEIAFWVEKIKQEYGVDQQKMALLVNRERVDHGQ